MPERGNDRLESFFKKVSGRPDISYNEEDWKRLEARLAAKEARSSIVRRNRNRISGASLLAVLMLGSIYWLTQPGRDQTSAAAFENQESINSSTVSDAKPTSSSNVAVETDISEHAEARVSDSSSPQSLKKNNRNKDISRVGTQRNDAVSASSSIVNATKHPVEINQFESSLVEKRSFDVLAPGLIIAPNDDTNQNNEIKSSPATADKIKQKATIADSVVMEKNDAKVKDAYGSGLTEHPASPRLSLLLSIAPDFSTVAFDYYADPGQSFGLMLHYHVKRSWSFSTGVVKSFKKYVGDGEDYAPPKGYWRNNTNGIIPETIDGSCNVLEIPVMIQYTIANKGKSRFLVGAGASSYIMLNESYKYNFEQPNPGAKKGWSSKKSSTMFFNVINVTAGFEHRIFPGFMMGIEPYLKIPIEGVGWSELKLYSVGASLTLRYIILNQKNPSVGIQNHGPG
ncbi:MAG TPA: hypothetical protein VK589_14200 [Chryseolinea sp.]|nr:hypothetical protein [Chryseolinea sp.]